jgi:molecular chaperone DnaK
VGQVIGIDLGTTNSCVAVLEGGQPRVIPSKDGSRTTPSIVAFTPKGDRLVGQIAKRQAVTNPQSTLYAVKRLIGRKFDSPEVKRASGYLSYELGQAPNGDVRLRVKDKDYSPSEIAAVILARLKEMAQEHLGTEINEAIITVPAYFDDAQRQATKDAGRIAGLEVLRIINEPTAASLAYGLQGKAEGRVAVYDLGGGTFDISILQLGEGVFEVKSTCGDTFLGGEDFDQRIVEWLLSEFQAESGADLRKDRLALQRLKESAEKAKCALSRDEECEISLPFIYSDATGPKHLQRVLTRDLLEEKVADLVERTRVPCLEAMRLAGVSPEQIDDVILVGGQTRMPKVIETVRDIFSREPNRDINPDEVVGIGAAIQAGILEGEVKDMVLLDVTPLSLGIETRGGMFTKIIERNSKIPTRKARTFTTVLDNQAKVEVHVLQGEREIANANKSLARFDLVGIPPAPKGVPQIDVSFEIDSNGIVHVSARDQATGREQRVVVTPSSGLSEREIEEMIEDAREHAEEDKKRAEFLKIKARLENMLEANEKAFAEFGMMLDKDKQHTVRRALESGRRALSTSKVQEVNRSLEKVGEAAQILTDVILYDPSMLTKDERPEKEVEAKDDSGST